MKFDVGRKYFFRKDVENTMKKNLSKNILKKFSKKGGVLSKNHM